jgi:hypothetical protein
MICRWNFKNSGSPFDPEQPDHVIRNARTRI